MSHARYRRARLNDRQVTELIGMEKPKKPEKKGWGFVIIIWLFALPLLGLAIFLNSITPEPPVKKESTSDKAKSDARAMCMLVLEKALDDPKSAQWGAFSGSFYGSWPAIVNENGDRVDVTPIFRAKNAFGSLIWTKWKCVVVNGYVKYLKQVIE